MCPESVPKRTHGKFPFSRTVPCKRCALRPKTTVCNMARRAGRRARAPRERAQHNTYAPRRQPVAMDAGTQEAIDQQEEENETLRAIYDEELSVGGSPGDRELTIGILPARTGSSNALLQLWVALPRGYPLDADQQPPLHFLLMQSMMRQQHFPGSGVRPTPVDSLLQVASAKAARLGAARLPLPMMSRR